MTKLNDEWATPDYLFDELNEEFHFDIDLCPTFSSALLIFDRKNL